MKKLCQRLQFNGQQKDNKTINETEANRPTTNQYSLAFLARNFICTRTYSRYTLALLLGFVLPFFSIAAIANNDALSVRQEASGETCSAILSDSTDTADSLSNPAGLPLSESRPANEGTLRGYISQARQNAPKNVLAPMVNPIQEHELANSGVWDGVQGPALLQSMLPEGVSFISHPLRDAEPGMVKSSGSGEAVFLRVKIEVDGKVYSTNVSVPKEALLANLIRQDKWLVGDEAKAVIDWGHGGGTSTTGNHTNIGLLNAMFPYGIYSIGMDQPWHGEGLREFLSKEEYLKFRRAFLQKFIHPKHWGKSIFDVGHSWGGVVADMRMRASNRPELGGDMIAGYISLSTVVDHAPGQSFAQKTQAERQKELEQKEDLLLLQMAPSDLGLSETLIRAAKVSPVAMGGATMLMLHNDWSPPESGGEDLKPILYVFGHGDPLFVGNEGALNTSLKSLPNARMVVMGPRVSFSSQTAEPVGHLIFDHNRMKPDPPITNQLLALYAHEHLGYKPDLSRDQLAKEALSKEFPEELRQLYINRFILENDRISNEVVNFSENLYSSSLFVTAFHFSEEFQTYFESYLTNQLLEDKPSLRTLLAIYAQQNFGYAESKKEKQLAKEAGNWTQLPEDLVSVFYQNGLLPQRATASDTELVVFESLKNHEKFNSSLRGFITTKLKEFMDMQTVATTPEVYTMVREFIEGVLGKKLESKPKEGNKNHMLANIVQLYANNLAFREFIKSSQMLVHASDYLKEEWDPRANEITRVARLIKGIKGNDPDAKRKKIIELLGDSNIIQSEVKLDPNLDGDIDAQVQWLLEQDNEIIAKRTKRHIPSEPEAEVFARENIRQRQEISKQITQLSKDIKTLGTSLRNLNSRQSALNKQMLANFESLEREDLPNGSILEAFDRKESQLNELLETDLLVRNALDQFFIEWSENEGGLSAFDWEKDTFPEETLAIFQTYQNQLQEYQSLNRKYHLALRKGASQGQLGTDLETLYQKLYGQSADEPGLNAQTKATEKEFNEVLIGRLSLQKELDELMKAYIERVVPDLFWTEQVSFLDLLNNSEESNNPEMQLFLGKWNDIMGTQQMVQPSNDLY